MRLGLLCDIDGDWKSSLEKVRIAEDLGFELVTTGESWGTSAIPWLTIIAVNTSRIQIGTGIVNCFSRSPAALAQEFATLDELSGGRMIFGVGTSGEYVIEHFHGAPFERPMRRMREYIEIFNLLISGEALNYSGEIFQMERGFKLDYQRPRDHIPVFIAAITPRSIRQTGEIADGIYPIHWPRQMLGKLREQLSDSAVAAGRKPHELTIAPWTQTFVLDGSNDDEQWRAARQPLHHYMNRMGVFYWQMFERHGYEAEVAASRTAWANRDPEGAIEAISEDMVRDIQVIGGLESANEQLHERSALGADIQMLQMPPGDPVDVGKTLEALAR